uniref:Uncharacterized protein n=1 Tax=Arundo donax TaxID=35708 RepID=A0A0A8YGT1_ARUDO
MHARRAHRPRHEER